MSDLRNRLLADCKAGRLLEAIKEEHSSSDKSGCLTLHSDLIALHNEKTIDVVTTFASLRNADRSPQFFLIRHILEEILPELDAPVSTVMTTVVQLLREGGQDLAAGTILESFVLFCLKDPKRPEEALMHIRLNSERFACLLLATVEARSQHDYRRCKDEILLLATGEDIELRRQAVFAIGTINWPRDADISSVISTLERLAANEADDLVLANTVRSAVAILKHDDSTESRIIRLADDALKKGSEYSLYQAAQSFASHSGHLSPALLDLLFSHFSRVDPSNKGTLEYLDMGLANLLKKDRDSDALSFTEKYLVQNDGVLTVVAFDRVVATIRSNPFLLNKIATRWLLSGKRVLAAGVRSIVDVDHSEDLALSIDPSEIDIADAGLLLFVVHKAIGFLFHRPISTSSMVISAMNLTSNYELRTELGSLLFDPILMNYSGKARDYVKQLTDSESDLVKPILLRALKRVEEYIENLKAVGPLPALYPTQLQREAHYRHFSAEMAEAMKRAEAGSSLLSLMRKHILLYGRKSVGYFSEPDGQTRRIETPLLSHEMEMECSRGELVDPVSLEIQLMIFRAEQIQE